MIPIQKSATVPAPLDGDDSLGGKATQELIAAIENGDEPPAFENSIYGHKAVKEQLIQDQHDKCAYCERAEVTANFHGDVEHFRPKAGWIQKEGEALNKPGYYWLAYEWTNLLFTCQLCNQTHKKNHFPLRTPKNRARSHQDDLTRERPILIDPTRENPSEFIEFRDGVPRGIDKGGRGKKTIKVLGLDRSGLNESRLRHLEHVRAFQISLAALLLVRKPDQVQVAAIEMCRAILQEFLEPKSEFTAMCRAILV